jgi:hypothetical protein
MEELDLQWFHPVNQVKELLLLQDLNQVSKANLKVV